jgi:hypothetical protein
VNRRFIALLVILAICLQGPSLAYASAAATQNMPTSCAGHTLGHSGHNSPCCCPQGVAPGLCCAGGLVFTGTSSALLIPLSQPLQLLSSISGSTRFATECPTPLLRPPIA